MPRRMWLLHRGAKAPLLEEAVRNYRGGEAPSAPWLYRMRGRSPLILPRGTPREAMLTAPTLASGAEEAAASTPNLGRQYWGRSPQYWLPLLGVPVINKGDHP